MWKWTKPFQVMERQCMEEMLLCWGDLSQHLAYSPAASVMVSCLWPGSGQRIWIKGSPSFGTGFFWVWCLKDFHSFPCISGQAFFQGIQHLPPHHILLIFGIYLKYSTELMFTIQPALSSLWFTETAFFSYEQCTEMKSPTLIRTTIPRAQDLGEGWDYVWGSIYMFWNTSSLLALMYTELNEPVMWPTKYFHCFCKQKTLHCLWRYFARKYCSEGN